MPGSYSVIVIGAGPAGLFAAKEILEHSTASVLILDKGKHPSQRKCNADTLACTDCGVCDVLCGGGGAGLFSDGKLVLDLNAGGVLEENLSDGMKDWLVNNIQSTFEFYDGESDKSSMDKEKISILRSKLESLGMKLRHYNVMRMGTKNLYNISCKFIDHLQLKYKGRVQFMFNTCANDIREFAGAFTVYTRDFTFTSDYLVMAVGKTGADWLKSRLSLRQCDFSSGNYYFGLRLETEYQALEELLSVLYDPKISKIFPDGTKLKFHCACRKGRIRIYKYNGFAVAGGHTEYPIRSDKNTSEKSNLNILLSIPKSIPPDSVLNRFAHISRNKLLVQKYSDFLTGRTTEGFGKVRPDNANIIHAGNLRSLLDDLLGFSQKMISFLDGISTICPGIIDGDNLLYGPVIEWCMDTVSVDMNMETQVPNLYAVGDGAGLSQGIVHAAATGIIAASAINYKVAKANETTQELLSARW